MIISIIKPHLLLSILLLLTFCLASQTRVQAWISQPQLQLPIKRFQSAISRTVSSTQQYSSRIAVPASELDGDLTTNERDVVSVVRSCGPSVAYVTSVLPFDDNDGLVFSYGGTTSRRRRGRNNRNNLNQKNQTESMLPRGQSLGSGSGFVVDSNGYLVTNFHVIERAYQLQSAAETIDKMTSAFVENITAWTGFSSDIVNATIQQLAAPYQQMPLPEVYVRINSDTRYQKCRIVDVKSDLDVAVLKIVNKTNDDIVAPVQFGSSSDLLVGQSLVAIGNPFGLDNSVTTGVVSALNRDLQTVGGRSRMSNAAPLRNCIQTDAAINPGNSGGPLMNLKGQVVGVNTAIVSTSGSNAGIGFAIPSDQVKPVVEKMIFKDMGRQREKGWLGISIVEQNGNSTLSTKNWVATTEVGSPAQQAGIQSMQILDNGSVLYGDAIVAVGGNEVSNYAELQKEMRNRVKGENLALTLESAQGDRRVVYVVLGIRPNDN